MPGRVRRVLLAVVIAAATGAFPAEQSMARTEVVVDGATVTLTVPVDLIGAVNDEGYEIGLKDSSAGVRTDVTTYWAGAAKIWNDAFVKLPFDGCINFKLDLQFFPKFAGAAHTPGHHAVVIDLDPNVRSVVFDPATPTDPTRDTTSGLDSDLTGDWGAADELTISHEVGHLIGLGDDYTDVKDANGNVTGSKPLPGRENTTMATSSSGNVDQNLVDRIGKLLDKAGKKLPKCWTGTMTSAANETVTANGIGLVCSGTWTTALSLTIATDGNITGTAVATVDGPPTCPHGQGASPQMEVFRSPIAGTATATELRFQLGTPSSYEPAGSGDYTGLTATMFGADPSGSTFTVPITSLGHAQGGQPLNYGNDANGKFTSENAIVLDCPRCKASS